MASDLPARITGIDIAADTTVANLEKVGCLVGRPTTTLTATPPTWRPDLTDPYDLVEEVVRIVGYDQVPSVLPREAAGRGLTREQRLRRRIGRTLAGAGCVEVISFPFVGEAAFDRLGLPADDVLRQHRPAGQPALDRGAVVHHDAAARPAPGGRPQPRPRRARASPLFETGTVAFPVDRGPAPIYGVDWRPSDDELAKLFEAIPEQPLHLAVVLAGERERAGWWGAGRDGGLVGRDRAGPPARRRARRRGRGGLGQPDAVAPGSLRPGPAWTGSSSATPASCTRRSARRSGCRRAPRPSRSTSTS